MEIQYSNSIHYDNFHDLEFGLSYEAEIVGGRVMDLGIGMGIGMGISYSLQNFGGGLLLRAPPSFTFSTTGQAREVESM